MELNRRGFVAAVSAIVVGSVGGCVGSVENQDGGGGSDGSDESRTDDVSHKTTSIAVLKSGDEVVQTQQVPVAWKKQGERAEKVNKRVQRKYGDLQGVRSTGIVNAKETVEGMHYSAVEVGVAPEYVEEVDEKIPDEIDGISVNVVEQEHTAVAA